MKMLTKKTLVRTQVYDPWYTQDTDEISAHPIRLLIDNLCWWQSDAEFTGLLDWVQSQGCPTCKFTPDARAPRLNSRGLKMSSMYGSR